MKKALSLLFLGAVVWCLAGCGNGGEDFDQNKIIQKQEGNGPPPLARPTGGGNPPPPANR